MGYYTRYSLSIIEGDDNLINELRSESEGAKYAIDEDGDTNEECKWYDYTDDLIKFSKKHPDAIFCLSGEGEESRDMWNTYFKDGHKQVCKARIVYDEFDKAKLLADIRDSKINKVIE
jgi:hypothetical protein